MKVCSKDIRVKGTLIRVARLDADMYEFLEDPEPTLQALRRLGVRVDLFTFMQRCPTLPSNIATRWSGTTWRPYLSRPSTIGGPSKLTPKLETWCARLRKKAWKSAS